MSRPAIPCVCSVKLFRATGVGDGAVHVWDEVTIRILPPLMSSYRYSPVGVNGKASYLSSGGSKFESWRIMHFSSGDIYCLKMEGHEELLPMSFGSACTRFALAIEGENLG